MATAPPRIGIAPCFFHPDPRRPVFKGKTLLYLEESLARWLMEGGALAYLLPTPAGEFRIEDLLAPFDGLVLQGGSDVAPESYGEAPVRREWAGDPPRDRYEIELVHACIRLGVPLLGICRGLQVVNVALGGTLYQDIATQHPERPVHRDWEVYDALSHPIRFEPGSTLARLHPEQGGARVNSVHHQGIRTLGAGLRVEARAVADGIVEAVRFWPDRPAGVAGDGAEPPFVYAVQWHPEFHDPTDPTLLATAPMRSLFLGAVEVARQRSR